MELVVLLAVVVLLLLASAAARRARGLGREVPRGAGDPNVETLNEHATSNADPTPRPWRRPPPGPEARPPYLR